MKLNQHFKDWKQIVSYRFPHLSLPQINGLTTWRTSHVCEKTSQTMSLTFGMVMTQSSSLTRVSTMAVAMLWMVTLGGEQELTCDAAVVNDRICSQSSFTPSVSCFLNGLLTVIAQLLNGQSISLARLFPSPLNYFSNLGFFNSS